MGIRSAIVRLLGGDLRATKQTTDPQNPAYWFTSSLGPESASGVNVSPSMALTAPAVYTCVRVIAESVASLPLKTYKRLERGKEQARSHILWRVLHDQPNPWMTSFTFWETMLGHVLLWGDAFAEIERTNDGKAIGLYPMRPDRMTVEVDDRKRVAYTYRQGDEKITLPARDVLHVPGLGFDGLRGYSPITLAREAVGLNLATERYGAKWFGNGARPSGVIQHPGHFKDQEVFNRFRESWNDVHQGTDNAHRVAILEDGITWQQVGLPPEDSQFLETRKFQKAEIYSIYRVPPHFAGDLDRATFSNIEHQDLGFVKHTLRPWLVRIEQAINSRLFSRSSPYFAEFVVDGLLRGDMKSRNESYAIGRQWGWYSINDIRERENMNPIEDGDDYLSPMNMIPVDQIDDMAASDPPASDPPASDDDETGSTRAIHDAHTDAIRTAFQLAVRREANWAKQSSGRKPGEFVDRASKYFDGHADDVRADIGAAVDAYAVTINGGPLSVDQASQVCDATRDAAEGHTSRCYGTLTGIAKELPPGGDLRGVVETWRDEWLALESGTSAAMLAASIREIIE